MNTPQTQNRERKRAEFAGETAQKKRFSPVLLLILAGVVGLAVYLVVASSSDKPATDVVSSARQADTATSPEIRIPVADLTSGKAKFFDYTLSDRTPVRFFA